MGMIEIKKDFSDRELMLFGPLMAVFAGLLGWLLGYQLGSPNVRYGIWGAAALLIVVYYAASGLQLAIYRGWLYAVAPIGWVVSHVLLAAIYYLLLTPIGLLMKVFGYDPMRRKMDRAASSYWVVREPKRDNSSYFKQF